MNIRKYDLFFITVCTFPTQFSYFVFACELYCSLCEETLRHEWHERRNRNTYACKECLLCCFSVHGIPDQHFDRILLERATQCHYLTHDTDTISIRHLQPPTDDVTSSHVTTTTATSTRTDTVPTANQNEASLSTSSLNSDVDANASSQHNSLNAIDKASAATSHARKPTNNDVSTNNYRHKSREKSSMTSVDGNRRDTANTSQRDSSPSDYVATEHATVPISNRSTALATDKQKVDTLQAENTDSNMQEYTVTSAALDDSSGGCTSQTNPAILFPITFIALAQFYINNLMFSVRSC